MKVGWTSGPDTDLEKWDGTKLDFFNEKDFCLFKGK